MTIITQTPTQIRSGAFIITPNDSADLPETAVGIYVGNTAGNIRFTTEDGDTLTMAVNTHQFLQLQIRKVFATGTTAAILMGLR